MQDTVANRSVHALAPSHPIESKDLCRSVGRSGLDRRRAASKRSDRRGAPDPARSDFHFDCPMIGFAVIAPLNDRAGPTLNVILAMGATAPAGTDRVANRHMLRAAEPDSSAPLLHRLNNVTATG